MHIKKLQQNKFLLSLSQRETLIVYLKLNEILNYAFLYATYYFDINLYLDQLFDQRVVM